VKTRCPTCKTRYNIDPEALLEADGLARCFRCGTVFEIVPDGSIEPNIIDMPTERPAFETDEDSVFLEDLEADASAPMAHNADDSVVVRSVSSEQADIRQQPETSPTATETADTIENAADAGGELPFAVPEDLKPIEPSPDDVQDIADTLHEKRSWRGFVYGLIALLLLAGIGMQLAWQQRKTLLERYPILEPLCARLECVPQIIRAPEKIRILQRDISPTAGEPDSLTLRVTIRNDAELAQPLPDLQLSLVNSDGGVLIRRRLSPRDYLGEAPPPGDNMAAGEVVTITLDFKDPGYEASGFVIDFF
jgi:predicted Zn finger-like uncharacterized protein